MLTTAPLPGPTDFDSRGAQARTRLIGVTLAGFCTFLQLYATQPLLPFFRRLFNATPIEVSYTVSAATLAVAITSPFIGVLADAVGRKRIIVPALLGLALPTFLCATANTLPQLIVWRFAQGLFVPGVIAVTLAYISEEAEAGTAGSLTAAYVTGTVLGGLCGRVFTGFAADHLTWRWGFAGQGALTLIGGMITWWLLPPSRRFQRHPHLLATVRAMGRKHLRNGRLLATYLAGFAVLFTHVGTLTYTSHYLAGEPFGLSSAALGSIFLVYALGVIITPASGPFIDRFGYRLTLIVAAMIVIIGALLTLVLHLWVVIAGIALLTTGIFIAQAAASSHIGAVAAEAKSAAAGLYVSLYYAGGSVGATGLGLAWGWRGWRGCVGAVVLIQFCTAMIACLFFRGRAAPHAAPPAEAALAAES